MPKTGVPTDASTTRTHTGTEQWQSFEIRMRHRRAERCVLRAEAALDAGLEAEARAALDEARSLDPDAPSFDELLAAARIRREAAAARARRQQVRRAAQVAAAALIIVLGIAWAMFEPHDTGDVETLVSSPKPVPIPALAQATTNAPPPVIDGASPPGAPSADVPSVPTAGERIVEPKRQGPVKTATPAPPLVRERISAPPGVDALPSPPAEPRPEQPPPTTTDAIARPPVDASLSAGALGAPARASIEAPTPPPAPAPTLAAASTPPEPVSQEPAVRDVLARFESAYSSLSASAAHQVWPSVDVRSLSRAFDGLESQQVSLGTCSIKVAASTARAECSGSATWTPKIGGGRRTEARRWEFDLTRAEGAWRIVRARAR
jgi:hypothetical protein